MRERSAWRVVIDANVWISALVFGGAPRELIESCVRWGVRLIVSAELETEIRRVVSVKFPDFSDDLDALFEAVEGDVDRVRLGSITIDACRDPDDNRVLETAVLGGADTIVSGDKDLLVLGEYDDIAILRPSEWIALRSGTNTDE